MYSRVEDDAEALIGDELLALKIFDNSSDAAAHVANKDAPFKWRSSLLEDLEFFIARSLSDAARRVRQ